MFTFGVRFWFGRNNILELFGGDLLGMALAISPSWRKGQSCVWGYFGGTCELPAWCLSSGFSEEKEGSEGWFMDWFHVTGMVSTWRWLTWGCRVNSSEPAPRLSQDLFRHGRMR